MTFSIGNIVHHSVLEEEGRIVRVAKVGKYVGYIVATVNKSTGREIEALWWPREVKELRERARKYRTRTA